MLLHWAAGTVHFLVSRLSCWNVTPTLKPIFGLSDIEKFEPDLYSLKMKEKSLKAYLDHFLTLLGFLTFSQ